MDNTQKSTKTQLKLKSKKFVSSNNFCNTLITKVSAEISYKIYLEYAKFKSSTKIKSISITNKLTEIQEYLILIESLLITYSQEESTKFKSTPLPNYQIESEFQFTFKKNKYSYELISLFLFQDGNHFVLYYKDPKFEDRKFAGWFLYDDFYA